MRNLIYKLLLIFILCSFTVFKISSNGDKFKVKQILIDLNNYYKKNPNYWVEIEYSLYDESQKLVQKLNGFYKHYNEFEHVHQFGIETIVNKNGKILIDSSKKTIILQPYQKYTNVDNSFDRYLDNCDDVKVIDSGNIKQIYFFQNIKIQGVKQYVITIEKNRLKKLELIKINPTTLKFNTIEISFSHYKNNKKLKKIETTFDTIIETTNNKFSVKPKYSGYKIIGSFNK